MKGWIDLVVRCAALIELLATKIKRLQYTNLTWLLLGAVTFLLGLWIGFLLIGCGAHARVATCHDAWDHVREMNCGSLISEGPDGIRDTEDDRTWLQLCLARQADPFLRMPAECIVKAKTCEEAETVETCE